MAHFSFHPHTALMTPQDRSVVCLTLLCCLSATVPVAAQTDVLRATERVLAVSETGAFDGTRWVLPLLDGSLLVPLTTDMTLERWSREGKPLSRWGRRGEGPGEFRIMIGGGFAGDLVWVNDPLQRRTTFFDASGVVRSIVRWVDVISGLTGMGGAVLTPRAWPDSTTFLGLQIPVGLRPEMGVRLAKASRSGVVEIARDLPVQQVAPGSCGRTTSQVIMLRCPKALHAFSAVNGQFAWVVQDAADDRSGWYRLEVRDRTGRVLLADSMPVARFPIAPERRDAIRRSVAAAVQRTGVANSDLPELAELPQFDPSVDAVHVAADGTAWIRASPGGSRTLWHRHRIGARRVDQWIAPGDFEMLWAGQAAVIGRRVGDDGVTRLVEFSFSR